MEPQVGFLSPIGPSSPIETQEVFEEAVNEVRVNMVSLIEQPQDVCLSMCNPAILLIYCT